MLQSGNASINRMFSRSIHLNEVTMLHADICGKNILVRKNKNVQSPDAVFWLICSKSSMEVSVAEVE